MKNVTSEKSFLELLCSVIQNEGAAIARVMIETRLEEIDQVCPECQGTGMVDIQEDLPNQEDRVYKNACICHDER